MERERETERENNRQIYHLLICSAGGHKGQGWAKSKPGVRATLCCFAQGINRELDWKLTRQDMDRHPCEIPTPQAAVFFTMACCQYSLI